MHTQAALGGTSRLTASMVGCIITAIVPSNIRFPNGPMADIVAAALYTNTVNTNYFEKWANDKIGVAFPTETAHRSGMASGRE